MHAGRVRVFGLNPQRQVASAGARRRFVGAWPSRSSLCCKVYGSKHDCAVTDCIFIGNDYTKLLTGAQGDCQERSVSSNIWKWREQHWHIRVTMRMCQSRVYGQNGMPGRPGGAQSMQLKKAKQQQHDVPETEISN